MLRRTPPYKFSSIDITAAPTARERNARIACGRFTVTDRHHKRRNNRRRFELGNEFMVIPRPEGRTDDPSPYSSQSLNTTAGDTFTVRPKGTALPASVTAKASARQTGSITRCMPMETPKTASATRHASTLPSK